MKIDEIKVGDLLIADDGFSELAADPSTAKSNTKGPK